MESRVSSRLSAKRYETTLNEVFDEDVNFKTQLYKVDIFGHNLHIAPGKVIYDPDTEDLVYCFVYAVQDDKPIMKLGVYEKIVESKDVEVFDLSEFKEGSMLLFEYYETNPTKVAELATSDKEVNMQNPFDLIRDNVYTAASDIYKFYESKSNEAKKYTKDAYNLFFKIHQTLEKSSPLEKILKTVIGSARKSFADEKFFNLHNIETMKTYCGDKLDEKFMVCLAVLSVFLKVKFVVINSEGAIYNDVFNFDQMITPIVEPTHYVILRNYDVYYQDKIQPFGNNLEDHDTRIMIQVYKSNELPTYLQNELQNVSAENAMIAEQAEENPEAVRESALVRESMAVRETTGVSETTVRVSESEEVEGKEVALDATPTQSITLNATPPAETKPKLKLKVTKPPLKLKTPI